MKTVSALVLLLNAFPLCAAEPPGTWREFEVLSDGKPLKFSFVISQESPRLWFGRFEITWQQYFSIMPDGDLSDTDRSNKNRGETEPTMPYQFIDLTRAVKFCRHLAAKKKPVELSASLVDWGFRLPSISEWQVAAAAGQERTEPFFVYAGDDGPLIFPKTVLGEGIRPKIGLGITWKLGDDDAIEFSSQASFLKFLDSSRDYWSSTGNAATIETTVKDEAQKLYEHFLEQYVGLSKPAGEGALPYHEVNEQGQTHNRWGIWDLHGNALELVIVDSDRDRWSSWATNPVRITTNSVHVTGNTFLPKDRKYNDWRNLSSSPQSTPNIGEGLGFRIVAVPQLNPDWNNLVYDQLMGDAAVADIDARAKQIWSEIAFVLEANAERRQLKGMFALAFTRAGDLGRVEKELKEAQELVPQDEATTKEIDSLLDYVQRLKDVRRRSAQAFGSQGL